LNEVFCGVLYLLKSGCQWRMLPSEYPKWRTVHSYFAKWSEPGPDGFSVLERALKNVVGEARIKQGRKSSTSFLIVDAQSVKNTDSAREKGYARARRFQGSSAILRSIPKDCPMRLPSQRQM
jgi:transposase